jgi:hypothetical protein
MVFESRELRRILGPKRDEVMGGWRKPHDKEPSDLNSLPSKIRIIKLRRMRWVRHVTRMGEKRNAYRLLVGKPEGRRPLERPRCRWVDNINIHLVETGWDGMGWIDLVQDRDKWRALVNTVMNFQVLQNAGKLLSGYTNGGLSSSAQPIELVC